MWHCFSLAPETLPVNSATPIEVIAVGASGGDRCEAATVASPSSIAGASTELEVLKVRAPGGDRVSSPTPVALFQPSRKGDGDGKSGYRRGQSVQLKPCRLRATDCLRRGSISHRTKHIAIIAAVICIKDESPTRKPRRAARLTSRWNLLAMPCSCRCRRPLSPQKVEPIMNAP